VLAGRNGTAILFSAEVDATMAIRIHGQIVLDGDKGYVTVEGDTVTDVNSTLARAMALQAARGHMTRPGIHEQSGPYPVDPDTGEPYDNPVGGVKPNTKYRQDFTLHGAL
jgi:hypothetical protein